MAQAFFLNGNAAGKGVFDYFFRKLPFDSGYAVFTGLGVLLEMLEELRFDESDIEYLAGQNFNKRFLRYLRDFRFTGSVYSSQEGDIVFPGRPVLTVEAPLAEVQIIETMLLNTLNYQTLIATKAARMRLAAGDRTLIDFGMRRAHGPAAHYAARAAAIGGFNATSNVKAAKDFNIDVAGTMAHSFIQSFDDELTAFRHYAEIWPYNCILLADTYNTLKSGIPNAIKVATEMRNRGHRLKGIRLDSGDLTYLSKKARKMLDDAGHKYVKITASNQLDEHIIASLLAQGAPIDAFGVGTSLVTGQPDGQLDGVYKLAFANGKPRIKLSETTAKITLPHKKQVYRVYNGDGTMTGADVVTLWDETDIQEMYHPFDAHMKMSFKGCKYKPLLSLVMKDGKSTGHSKNVSQIADYCATRIMELPAEYKRFENPHIYKVGLSDGLNKERNMLIKSYKED